MLIEVKLSDEQKVQIKKKKKRDELFKRIDGMKKGKKKMLEKWLFSGNNLRERTRLER